VTRQERLQKLRYRIEAAYRMRRDAQTKYNAAGIELAEANAEEAKARNAYLGELEMIAAEKDARRGR